MTIRRIASLFSIAALAACTAPAAPAPEHSSAAPSPIVGGTTDAFRTYVVGVGDDSGIFCTGTLISKRTVLTAGHCFTPKLGATGGITTISFGVNVNATSKPVSVAVAKAMRHPAFDPNTLTNDLTLVELAADPPAGFRQPAPLLRETLANTADFVGPNFTFVGYGNDGSEHYGVRRVATFPIARVGPAIDVGLDTQTGPIDGTMFYYRFPAKNTCDGDSGGPAFVVRDNVERLAGSTSFGDLSCSVDGVDGRTDAPQIAAFIQPGIDSFEGDDPCRADGMCNESCNTGGELIDPDCAPSHCGADGICVLSCSDPPDPDCVGIDHCGTDGICDPSCAQADPDCSPPDAGAPGTGGATGGGGALTSTSTATTSSASSSAATGGTMVKSQQDAGTSDMKMDGGCALAATSSIARGGEPLAWLVALGAIVAERRRRSRALA